jgi:hypothetical protein
LLAESVKRIETFLRLNKVCWKATLRFQTRLENYTSKYEGKYRPEKEVGAKFSVLKQPLENTSLNWLYVPFDSRYPTIKNQFLLVFDANTIGQWNDPVRRKF